MRKVWIVLVPLLLAACSHGEPAPASIFEGAHAACGDVFAYREALARDTEDDERSQAVVLSTSIGSLMALGMAEGESRKTFDLAQTSGSVDASLIVFQGRLGFIANCYGVRAANANGSPEIAERWRATSGTVFVRMFGPAITGRAGDYDLTTWIENATFSFDGRTQLVPRVDLGTFTAHKGS